MRRSVVFWSAMGNAGLSRLGPRAEDLRAPAASAQAPLALRDDSAPGARIGLCAADAQTCRRIDAALLEGGHELIGTSASPEALIELARATTLEVIVLVCQVEPSSSAAGLHALRTRLESTPLVGIATGPVGAVARKLVHSDLDGLLHETEIEKALVATVDAVLAKQVCVPVAMRRTLVAPVFTHREKQVLEMVLAGLTNGQIAGELYLTESTVKSHLASSFRKLGVCSRAEAARCLLDPGSEPVLGPLDLANRRLLLGAA